MWTSAVHGLSYLCSGDRGTASAGAGTGSFSESGKDGLPSAVP